MNYRPEQEYFNPYITLIYYPLEFISLNALTTFFQIVGLTSDTVKNIPVNSFRKVKRGRDIRQYMIKEEYDKIPNYQNQATLRLLRPTVLEDEDILTFHYHSFTRSLSFIP